VGSVGVAKQQSDLKRSFSQIHQIDLSIFVDRSQRSERVEKNAANVTDCDHVILKQTTSPVLISMTAIITSVSLIHH